MKGYERINGVITFATGIRPEWFYRTDANRLMVLTNQGVICIDPEDLPPAEGFAHRTFWQGRFIDE